MSTIRVVVVALISIGCFSIVCANNDTELLRSFARLVAQTKCCSDEDQVRCGARLNGTLAVPIARGRESTLACCTECLRRTLAMKITKEISPSEEAGTEVKENSTRSCFAECFSNNSSNEAANFSTSSRNDALGSTNEIDSPKNSTVNDAPENGNDTLQRNCDSIFSSLNFWGANIVVFANAIYIVPYFIVVIVYFAIPSFRARAYDRAVISFNISQISLNSILIGLGASVLCHATIVPVVLELLGLMIMFLTISSTCWLVVVCFDMTLVITRFRWAPPSNDSREEEKKKFWTYTLWTLGTSLLPTTLACVFEFSTLLPASSPIRPNFARFDDGANLAVIVYVISLPALCCLVNTVLFFYTTYRMILIRKSTAVATDSSTAKTNKTIWRRYFVFLKLYFLMDSPWFTGALAAVYPDLWILKFLRMIQPFLMLLAILPHRNG